MTNLINLDTERTKRFVAAAEAISVAAKNHAPKKFLDAMAMRSLRYARASAVPTDELHTSVLRELLARSAELAKEAA